VTTLALAAWLYALPLRPCTRSTAVVVARVALRVAPKYGVSARLLGLVACYESRGRKAVLYRNRNGSCDVGRWQINCPRCSVACRERYLPDHRNAGRAARILRAGRWVCARRPGLWYCRLLRPWCRYNPGSRRWCEAITRMWRPR